MPESPSTGADFQVQGLHKSYPRNRDFLSLLRHRGRSPRHAVLTGLDMKVTGGGIHALLGPNGAGKTTLLKTLAGLLQADAGSIRVDERELVDQPAALRQIVGLAVCEERSFFWRLSARENLRFFASLGGLRRSRRDERVQECLTQVGLGQAADRPFMEFSSGMRQALALARGLLLKPRILLMDEPTRSLDPEATLRIHELVRGLVDEDPRRIVLYSTHDLGEAESISSHIWILREGRIVTQGRLAEALQGSTETGYRYLIRTEPGLDRQWLARHSGLEVLGEEAAGWSLLVSDLEVLNGLVDALRAKGHRLTQLQQQGSSLRELYHGSKEQEA